MPTTRSYSRLGPQVILQVRRRSNMDENPYSTPPQLPPEIGDPRAHGRPLWRAYAFAPAAAPVSFVAFLFVVGAICIAFGIEINPASFLVLPVVAMTVGMAVCYLVAGCIGMPIAFQLRKHGKLNGYTIHLAAFGWALFVSLVVGVPAAIYSGAPWYQIPLAPLLLLAAVAPPVLLSGTSFWWLVRRNGGLSTPQAR